MEQEPVQRVCAGGSGPHRWRSGLRSCASGAETPLGLSIGAVRPGGGPVRALLYAAAVLTAVTGVTAAPAQETLIRNAKAYTLSDGVRESTDVLVRDGKIAAVGEKLKTSPGAALVDAHGQALTPGIFGGLSQIGAVEISAEPSTVDDNLTFKAPDAEQQWRPEFD